MCLASVRAQSVDLNRLIDIPACPAVAVKPLPYLYGMYDKNLSYLYVMYYGFVYDLYVLYDSFCPKNPPNRT